MKRKFHTCHLYTVGASRGWALLGKVTSIFRNFSRPDNATINANDHTMDANTRDFETELQAQDVEQPRETAKLHPEAEPVTATAL